MNNPIGIMLPYYRGLNLMKKLEKAANVGIHSCQLCVVSDVVMDPNQVQIILDACKGIRLCHQRCLGEHHGQ